MEKKEIRKKVLDIRNQIPEEVRRNKSIQIAEKLCGMPCFREASAVLVYRDFRSEAETTFMIEKAWESRKEVYCPRVEGKEMEFYLVRRWEDFESGSYGIQEPKRQCPVFKENPDIKVLVILPGAAFDRDRHRIGYGGGYYDRYLSRHPKLFTAAVCFEEQMTAKLPSEPFDIRPQIIVTDQECYK